MLHSRSDFLVNNEQADLYGFLHSRIFLPRSDHFCAIGRIVNGHIVGVFGYDNHLPGASCQMHAASDGSYGWLNRRLLWKAFQVPFVEWGYRVVISPIASDNADSIALATKLGFLLQCSIQDAHPGGALNLYTLTKEQGQRWLALSYKDVNRGKGRERTISA